MARSDVESLAEPLGGSSRAFSTVCDGPVGIGVLHPPAPDAAERFGPRVDPGSGRIVAVSGRFVSTRETGPSGPSDPLVAGPAAWALAAGAHLDPELLAGVAGPFALIAADPRSGWLAIARDHLGSEGVSYHLDSRWLVAASEAAAVLRHPAVSGDLDEHGIAQFLGFRFGHDGRSFFRDVRELEPAHRLRVSRHDERRDRYWRFRRLPDLASLSDDEVRSGFLDRLRRAVGDETAGLEPSWIALSLSGGLDSTAVAAVAPRGIRCFSWSFDDHPQADERDTVETVARFLDLGVDRVIGDGAVPFAEGVDDFAARFLDPSSPYVNAFAPLKARLYDAARAEGCRRMLVGDAGDALYSAREYWLRDLLLGGGKGDDRRRLSSLAETVRRTIRGDLSARAALKRVVPRPLLALRRVLGGPRHPWLTDEARSLVPADDPSPYLPLSRDPHRYELAVGAKHVELERSERRSFRRYGIERGNPFWSWPLLEWGIQLPAQWFQRGSKTKVLSREALRGYLPDEVLEGPRGGNLGPFFLQGIAESRSAIRDLVFRDPRSDWQRYVDRSWVEPYLSETGTIDFGQTILWLVVSYELWIRRFDYG